MHVIIYIYIVVVFLLMPIHVTIVPCPKEEKDTLHHRTFFELLGTLHHHPSPSTTPPPLRRVLEVWMDLAKAAERPKRPVCRDKDLSAVIPLSVGPLSVCHMTQVTIYLDLMI